MMKRLAILALVLCLAPAAARATVCGTSTTWQNTPSATTAFGANLVSGLNYACSVIVDPTTPANALGIDSNNSVKVSGACKSVINISQTSSTDVHTFTGYGHICSIVLVSATAQNIGVDEGTGTTCETSGTALIGVSSTSAATPQISVSATQGFVATAAQPWLTLQASADHLCVLQSGSGEVAGTITYTDLTNP